MRYRSISFLTCKCPVFPAPFGEEVAFPLMFVFGIFVESKSPGFSWTGVCLCSLFCPIPSVSLFYTSVLLLLWLCSRTSVKCGGASSAIVYAQHYFGYCSLLCLHLNLRNFFLFLGWITLEFWWRLHWICRLLLVGWPFHSICSFNPQMWEVFPSFQVFFWFLSVLKFLLPQSLTCFIQFTPT